MKEVDRMRNQVMSFTNDGAEFQLNVPDTNEVKENLSELGMFRAAKMSSLSSF